MRSFIVGCIFLKAFGSSRCTGVQEYGLTNVLYVKTINKVDVFELT
jgi:hypothetical protein